MKAALRRRLLDNAKNVVGWRTDEKLVVFAVDDYGNVRLDSKKARNALQDAGLDLSLHFDRVDAVETREDLEALYETLSSVTDGAGRHAVFTPYTLPANLDFEAVRRDRDAYHYETLPQTFERLSAAQPAAYEGTWTLWKEGIARGLMRPQSHGREHLNVEVIERRLAVRDEALEHNLVWSSLAAIPDEPTMPGVSFTHAFEVADAVDIERHRDVLAGAADLFREVFGFASTTFTPPALRLHPALFEHVESLGFGAIHKPLFCTRRLARKVTQREANFTGRRPGQRHATMVRNVVFEPTDRADVDSVAVALEQIRRSFRWRRPAIISSHRVNFAGHIEPANRDVGLRELRALLRAIVERWPDVQFVGADELLERMEGRA